MFKRRVPQSRTQRSHIARIAASHCTPSCQHVGIGMAINIFVTLSCQISCVNSKRFNLASHRILRFDRYLTRKSSQYYWMKTINQIFTNHQIIYRYHMVAITNCRIHKCPTYNKCTNNLVFNESSVSTSRKSRVHFIVVIIQ